MTVKTNPKKIEELLKKRVESVIDKNNLLKKLRSRKKLRVKLGIDPTGPRIHLGRAIQFWKLKEFQELGHIVLLIIGDFTAQIGDASDKATMRRTLTEKEIKENMKNYKKQIGKILNLKKTKIYYNSQWLKKIQAKKLIQLTMHFTAQQMIQRRNFKERWEKRRPIGLHELLYPIFQGYDSVMVKSDLEIGGSDQLFNLKTGREIQKIFGLIPQDIMTLKMLRGLDGKKMSTSQGNIINITDKPSEMFGKLMTLKDDLIPEYFELCTFVSSRQLEKIKKDLKNKKVNPRDMKVLLAKEIISLYYGKKTAEKAEKEFNKIFREKKMPSVIPEIEIKEKRINILDLLFKTGLVSSKSEAKRLILQKGVRLNGVLKDNWKEVVLVKKGIIIKVGKRRFVKIK